MDVSRAEESLIGRAEQGDRAAFERLMRGQIRQLYPFILLHVREQSDADDIVQETMLAVWQGLKGFHGASGFATWVFGICRRKIADFYRKAYSEKQRGIPLADAEELPDNSTDPLDTASVSEAVKTLPARDRELLYLVFNARLTYEEAGRVAKLPVGTVKSRMHAIREKLRPLLEGRD